jgi:hypothetical protein
MPTMRSLWQCHAISISSLITSSLVFLVLLAAPSCADTQQPVPMVQPPDGRLHDARFGATATLLLNGQVLIVGGVALDTTASP